MISRPERQVELREPEGQIKGPLFDQFSNESIGDNGIADLEMGLRQLTEEPLPVARGEAREISFDFSQRFRSFGAAAFRPVVRTSEPQLDAIAEPLLGRLEYRLSGRGGLSPIRQLGERNPELDAVRSLIAGFDQQIAGTIPLFLCRECLGAKS